MTHTHTHGYEVDRQVYITSDWMRQITHAEGRIGLAYRKEEVKASSKVAH